MINIYKREDCSGCSACEQVCPTKCISLIPDKEGYWYPSVRKDECIDCNLCVKICPVINQNEETTPLDVYAAINKDETVRAKSASGGIFTIVAEKIIKKGGVVFGVKFDEDWNVVFGYTETIEGLNVFRRSKYVQAWLGDSFSEVKTFLKKGRLVLFVGTPCQVAGLRNYLGKEYDNLLLMDLICEGVPSPKVWKRYLEEELARQGVKTSSYPHRITKKDCRLKDVSFRNKTFGWKKMSFALTFANTSDEGEENTLLSSYINRDSAYMQAMFQYLDLRPICYKCPFKSCKSHSDITIADYWGINVLHPEMDDDKGTSMVYVNTEKGRFFYDIEQTKYKKTTYEEAFKYNNIVTSSKLHPYREKFFAKVDDCDSIIRLLEHYKFTKKQRLKNVMKSTMRNILNFILPDFAYNSLKKLWGTIRKI